MSMLVIRIYHIAGIMSSVRDFNRNNNSGRGHSFGDKRQFGNRFDRPRPTMYKTICSKCGKDCEVPFKPTGEKPVLCRDCFRESGGQARRPEERSFSRPSFQDKSSQKNEYGAQLDALTTKVDKILEILTAAATTNIASENGTEEAVEPTPEKKKRTTKKSI